MARTFTMDCFLGKASRELLDVYFTNRRITLPVMPSQMRVGDPDGTNALMRGIMALPTKEREEVETDFHELFYLGNKAGIDELIRIGTTGKTGTVIDLMSELESWPVLHDKALWTMLHHYPIFALASEGMKVLEVKGYRRAKIGMPAQRPATDAATCQRLADATKAYYTRQGRGEQCAVRGYEHGEMTYYCAYPLDYALREPSYLPDGTLVFTPQRDTFDLIWRLNHQSGLLGIHAPDLVGPVFHDLVELFVAAVITTPVTISEPAFELECLRTVSDEALLAQAKELFADVEDVRLKELSLQLNHLGGQYVTLGTGRDHSRPWVPMPEFQQRTLNHQDPILAQPAVAGATLQVKFPGKGKRGSVTARLRAPSTCYLDDTPNARKVMRLLEHWGIDRGRRTTYQPAPPADSAGSL
jgi:hypothetical protein